MRRNALFLNLEIQTELHPFERKLIEKLRSIRSGEVTSIKVQDGLPVIIQIAHEENDFLGTDR